MLHLFQLIYVVCKFGNSDCFALSMSIEYVEQMFVQFCYNVLKALKIGNMCLRPSVFWLSHK